MHAWYRAVFSCLIFSLLILQTRNLCAQVNRAAAQPQILLLRNGNILQGQVERVSDGYSIQTVQGSRLVIALDKVELLAHSMTDAYWQRLSLIPANREMEQESLFYWCIKYKLWNEADNQLEVLAAIDVDSHRLGLLRNRLAVARNEAQTVSPSTVSSPSKNERMLPNGLQQADRLSNNQAGRADLLENIPAIFSPLPPIMDSAPSEMVANEPVFTLAPPIFEEHQRSFMLTPSPLTSTSPTEIAHVGYDEPTQQDTVSEPALPDVDLQPGGIPNRELDAFIKQLPPHSFTAFKSHIERRLIQSCGECHRLNSNQTATMPLMFRSKSAPLSLRMSQRNAHSVAMYLSDENPESSVLLEKASQAHGGQTTASFPLGSKDRELLKAWVMMMKPDDPSVSQSVGQSSSTKKPSEPSRIDNLSSTAAWLVPAPHTSQSAETPATFTPSSRQLLAPIPATIGDVPNLDAKVIGFVPRDEFDPEIFNRMHRDPAGAD